MDCDFMPGVSMAIVLMVSGSESRIFPRPLPDGASSEGSHPHHEAMYRISSLAGGCEAHSSHRSSIVANDELPMVSSVQPVAFTTRQRRARKSVRSPVPELPPWRSAVSCR